MALLVRLGCMVMNARSMVFAPRCRCHAASSHVSCSGEPLRKSIRIHSQRILTLGNTILHGCRCTETRGCGLLRRLLPPVLVAGVQGVLGEHGQGVDVADVGGDVDEELSAEVGEGGGHALEALAEHGVYCVLLLTLLR